MVCFSFKTLMTKSINTSKKHFIGYKTLLARIHKRESLIDRYAKDNVHVCNCNPFIGLSHVVILVLLFTYVTDNCGMWDLLVDGGYIVETPINNDKSIWT